MLPIAHSRDRILDSVTHNQVTIVVGETGSGKTTEIPRYLFEAGFGKTGMIGVTEPRRIAAISVAAFVAQNLGVRIGSTVAHKIRFDDQTHRDTVVKFMTDGVLLRELHSDPMLSKYSVIVVDEAHERSSNIDFLLGLLKQVLAKRPELRVIVASATIDAEKFSRYFGGAPVLDINGRLHPVQVVWDIRDYQPGDDVVEAAAAKVKSIVDTSSTGDIMVFLTGLDEITMAARLLEVVSRSHNLLVLPLHGSLAPEDQAKIFKSSTQRKVILATNIAETSITVDGVVYVVDSGFVKQTDFDPLAGIQSLGVVAHSQAGCAQRAGRAGRTQPGICYRLYTEDSFKRRPAFTMPEIKRISLAGVVLAMEALEIPNIKNFDFIDPPDATTFLEAYDTLEALGAIDSDKPGLTAIGKEMAALPLEPRISRMVIEARRHGCVENIVTIAAVMSVGRSVFVRPQGKEMDADRAHARFAHRQSDMLTILRMWKAFCDTGFDRKWCTTNFLSSKTLQEVRQVRLQLLEQLRRSGVEVTKTDDETAVLRSVAAGLVYNLLESTGRHAYMGVERDLDGVYIHPGSSTFGGISSRWMVAAEVVETKKLFARMCSIVKPEWLPEIAPNRFKLGEPSLRATADGYETRHAVLYKDKWGCETNVGFVSRPVSVEEARRLHEQGIRAATLAGWTLLTAVEVPGRFGLQGRSPQGTLHILSSSGILPVEGGRYYCERAETMSRTPLYYPRLWVFPELLRP